MIYVEKDTTLNLRGSKMELESFTMMCSIITVVSTIGWSIVWVVIQLTDKD